MNETTMTVIGNVVENPKLRRTKNGHFVANFRLAATTRRFDRENDEWKDSNTLFVTVTAWRALGENVARSITKGQRVIAHGRYCQREYEQNEMLRTAYELEATAVGPDLSRGVTTFEKVSRPTMVVPVEVDDDGMPADVTDAYLDLASEHEYAVDPNTGEVAELAAV